MYCPYLFVFSGPPEKKMGIKASNTAEVSALKTSFIRVSRQFFMHSNDKIGAKRDSFTACHSGKLKQAFLLALESFKLARKFFLMSRIDYSSSAIWIPYKTSLEFTWVENRVQLPESKIR